MAVADRPAALKVVGSNGQISLGKQYAGRMSWWKNASQGCGLSAPRR